MSRHEPPGCRSVLGLLLAICALAMMLAAIFRGPA